MPGLRNTFIYTIIIPFEAKRPKPKEGKSISRRIGCGSYWHCKGHLGGDMSPARARKPCSAGTLPTLSLGAVVQNS